VPYKGHNTLNINKFDPSTLYFTQLDNCLVARIGR